MSDDEVVLKLARRVFEKKKGRLIQEVEQKELRAIAETIDIQKRASMEVFIANASDSELIRLYWHLCETRGLTAQNKLSLFLQVLRLDPCRLAHAIAEVIQ